MAWQLEEESTKTRLLLPSLQAANKELQSTVQRLREREAERMAMTIEAEQTATSLRRELADATAALERSSQARAQLEERLGAVREQLEREQREHRRASEEHAATVGRLRKERRALRLVSTEHGAQTAEYVTKKYKRLTLGGWSIGLPGAPGRLLAALLAAGILLHALLAGPGNVRPIGSCMAC